MSTTDLPQDAFGVGVPDSKLAADALKAVKEAAPDFLFNHSLRVFAFGSLMCRKHGRTFDPELGFVAAIMHDLGLTDQYATADHRFEVDSADAAHRFLTEHHVAGRRPSCHLYTWAGWVARDYAHNPDAPAAETLHSTHWTD